MPTIFSPENKKAWFDGNFSFYRPRLWINVFENPCYNFNVAKSWKLTAPRCSLPDKERAASRQSNANVFAVYSQCDEVQSGPRWLCPPLQFVLTHTRNSMCSEIHACTKRSWRKQVWIVTKLISLVRTSSLLHQRFHQQPVLYWNL